MPEPDRILRIRTVLNRTGLSRSTLYRKMSDGSFPRQVKIGEIRATGIKRRETPGNFRRLCMATR
jgi:predicted DNA-binding transcriptional regulator AlpA